MNDKIFSKIMNLLNSYDYQDPKRKTIHDGIIKCNPNLKNWFINQGEMDHKLKEFDSFGLNRNKRKEKIVVSITSMPSRYWMLPYSLYSLMNQTEKPDRIILTLWEKEYIELPDTVKRFENYGLEYVIINEDLNRGKKLFPLFETEDDDTLILFGDDDLYYKSNWLKDLYDAYMFYRIPCYYLFDKKMNIEKRRIDKVSGDKMSFVEQAISRCPMTILLTGIGCMLSLKDFHPDVRKRDIAKQFGMMNDDELFLYCVSKLNGLIFQKIKFDHQSLFCDLAFPTNNFETSTRIEDEENDRNYNGFLLHYGFSSLEDFVFSRR